MGREGSDENMTRGKSSLRVMIHGRNQQCRTGRWICTYAEDLEYRDLRLKPASTEAFPVESSEGGRGDQACGRTLASNVLRPFAVPCWICSEDLIAHL